MNKILMLLFLLASNNLIFSQNTVLESNDSIVVWSSSNKLSWSNFKVVKKDSLLFNQGYYHAIAATGIYIRYTKRNNKYNFFVYTLFYKYDSHILVKTDNLLLHEQIHFDIVELFSRKLRVKFNFLKQNDALYEDYLAVFSKVENDLDKYHDLYDVETNHSENAEKQKEWETKIKKELDEYDDFSFEKCYPMEANESK